MYVYYLIKDFFIMNELLCFLFQDGALNEAPTITTYRAVSSSQNGGSGEPAKIPASLKNIKRLSTCEDVVTLSPSR